MENSFQTSFIPKKPIINNGATSSGSNTTSITMVVSVFIFVVVVAASVGLYLYKGYLLKTQKDLSASLEVIRNSFDKDTIATLETFDKRTVVSKQILDNHLVLSPLFDLLNDVTLPTIQYTKFDHKTVGSIFSVKMSGIARDYKSIAQQSDIFNTDKGKMFNEVIFSNLNKDKNNYVTFDVEFNVDNALLSYSNNVTNQKIKTNTDVAIPTITTPNTTTENTPTAPAVGGEVNNTMVPPLPATTNNIQ